MRRGFLVTAILVLLLAGVLTVEIGSLAAADGYAVRNNIINLARQQLGKPYIFGNEGPNSFDCSGLVYYCYSNCGVNIQRLTAADLWNSYAVDVGSWGNLLPGDCVWFGDLGHIGIWTGSTVIQASNYRGQVCEDIPPSGGGGFSLFGRIAAGYWPNGDNSYNNTPWSSKYYGTKSVPTTMVCGSTAYAWFEFENSGTSSWDTTNTHLGCSNPQDRSSPFYNSSDWFSGNRPTAVDAPAAPGAGGRFTFILMAPSIPGTYTEYYKVMQEGVAWFGDEASATINVYAPGIVKWAYIGHYSGGGSATHQTRINTDWVSGTYNGVTVSEATIAPGIADGSSGINYKGAYWHNGTSTTDIVNLEGSNFWNQQLDNGTTYCAAYFKWTGATRNDVYMCTGSDDCSKVWLNGTAIGSFVNETGRSCTMDSDFYGPFTLTQNAWYRLVMKVENDIDDYQIYARFCNSDKSILDVGTIYVKDATAPTNPTSCTESHGVTSGVAQSSVSSPSFTWSGAGDSQGTDEGVSGIKGYKVYFGTSSSGTPSTFQTGATYSPGAQSIGTYYLRVSTVDYALNESAATTVFTFKYASTYSCEVYSDCVPRELICGTTVPNAYVKYKNTGTSTWDPTVMRIGSVNGDFQVNYVSPFYTYGDWIADCRPTGVDAATAPGAIGKFSFKMTAPNTPGTYVNYWRPLQEGATWMDGYTGGTYKVYAPSIKDWAYLGNYTQGTTTQHALRITTDQVTGTYSGVPVSENELAPCAADGTAGPSYGNSYGTAKWKNGVSYDDITVDLQRKYALASSGTGGTGAYWYRDMDYPNYTVKAGDCFEYDILYESSSQTCGALELGFTSHEGLRGVGTDQNGVSSHPGTYLADRAYKHWYHRIITLDDHFVGKVISVIEMAHSASNAVSDYRVRNVRITNKGVTQYTSYTNQSSWTWPTETQAPGNVNYTNTQTGVAAVADFYNSDQVLNSATYCSAYFKWTGATRNDVYMSTGADDCYKVWLNGTVIGSWAPEPTVGRYCIPDSDLHGPFTLTQNTWYRLLMKVESGYLGYGIYARFCNSDKSVLDVGTIYVKDATAPTNPTSCTEAGGAANNTWQNSVSSPSFTWSGAGDSQGTGEGVSGVKGYKVYFGTSSSGTPSTFQTSASYSPGAQANGTYYLRVSTVDYALNESAATTLFTFKYDNTAPTLSIGSPSASLTTGGPIAYTITYSGADAVTLANANVTINKTGTANGTVAVSGTGNTTRTVTISSITGDGTLGISIASGTASDTAGNSAAAAGPSAVFTVINHVFSYGLNNKATRDSIMSAASSSFVFTVWGKVTVIDANSFTVDDGSNKPVTVVYANHGFANNDYVSATGTLNISGTTPVLTAQVVKKQN